MKVVRLLDVRLGMWSYAHDRLFARQVLLLGESELRFPNAIALGDGVVL